MTEITREKFLLVKLMEECAEVTQRASKMFQFGAEEKQAGYNKNNMERLIGEIIDLQTVVSMMEAESFLAFPNGEDLTAAAKKKMDSVEKFYAYGKELGEL